MSIPEANISPQWTLQMGDRTLALGPAPVVMGIINVTPDSFSDGGEFLDAGAAVDHGLEMAAAGDAILDVGGESTRPGAPEVPAEDEIGRVLPVISALKTRCDAFLSIDTRKAQVARRALDAGADMVNDVSALGDPAMGPLVARAACPVVLMHMQGTPETMQQAPHYRDVVADVRHFLANAVQRAVEFGISPDQTILDPGIGFGKTVDHNLALLRRLGALTLLGRPILVGTSRKSFIGHVLGSDPAGRLMGTVASCVWTRAQGAAIFRVHDVAQVAQALAVTAAIEQAEETNECPN